MRYISMFSGIEAASVAFGPLGWRPVCFAEIEGFPSAVLAHHYPDVPNIGDMTTHDWVQYRDRCDLVVGGPPCQAFSVAGLRGSLDDVRGNLSLSYMRAIHAINPLWCITENVPGWLSTKDNAFGCFLAGLVGEDAVLVPPGGRWTDAGVVAGPDRVAAWRILDAQFFGVPQRRRRVFVVSSRGAGNWSCAAALFPVGKSVPRHPPPRREAGERVARPVAAGSPHGSGYRNDADTADNLIAGTLQNSGKAAGSATQQDAESGLLVTQAFGGNDTRGAIDVATACNAHGGPHGRLDFESETFIAHSLRADGFDASEDGTGRGTPLVPVAFDWQGGGIQTTLGASEHGTGALGTSKTPAVATTSHVRRLTPRETERLQGFPDDWTLIPAYARSVPKIVEAETLRYIMRGNPGMTEDEGRRWASHPDGPRYKSIGNSMAIPVVRWIGERIAMVEALG